MLKDRDGHIWIGTDTEGLIQIKLREVQAITRDDGLPENGVSTLLEDHSGNLWIGLRNRGLCKISTEDVLTQIPDVSGLGIKALYEDLDGTIWCGTQNNGLYKIKNNLSYHITRINGLSSNSVTSILRDHTNILWIGTELGLYSYRQSNVLQEKGALIDKKINVLFEGNESILYAGTDEGLYQKLDTGWERPDSSLSSEVLSLYEDQEGVLWIGTNGNGLKIRKDNHISTITKSQGLNDDHILSISTDEDDNLWMSSYNGVFAVNRNHLLNIIKGEEQFIYSMMYDETDGMTSRQCSGNVQPAVWKTNEGKLLYPTVKGVSVFNPKYRSGDALVPEILLEELIIDETVVKVDQSELLRFSGDHYEFHFTAIDYSAPEKLRFEYMLKGYDKNYNQLAPDRARSVGYQNLGAGTYQLLVKVANREGIQTQSASLINFEIFTPFYAHPIFIMLLIMIVLTISSSLVYLRHQRKVNNQIEKYKTSRLDKEMADKTKEKIKTMMASEKLYLDPDLSLKDLSSRLKIHSNYISRIINEQFKMSYNDYINMHRIEDVKTKLSDPEINTKTVLEIMYETGFYSKSVFNTAFKKFTGITPSEYRKTHATNR